jgi:hypothetical protein
MEMVPIKNKKNKSFVTKGKVSEIEKGVGEGNIFGKKDDQKL